MTEYGVNQRALASYARRIGYLQRRRPRPVSVRRPV